jgi:hypothetical protein
MMLDHADTRARWTDNRRVTFCKGTHKVQRDRPGLIFKTIIEERLSTAGLLGRENQFHAETFQDAGHVLKRGCVELIAETGNEKLGFWHDD